MMPEQPLKTDKAEPSLAGNPLIGTADLPRLAYSADNKCCPALLAVDRPGYRLLQSDVGWQYRFQREIEQN